MKNKNEDSIQGVLEEVTYILNEIKHKRFTELRKLKLNTKQESLIEDVEKDLDVCVTKLGLVLHPTEL